MKAATSLCAVKPYKSDLERSKNNTVMLCKARIWQKSEQDEEEQVRGQKKEVSKWQPTHSVTSDGGGGNSTWLSTRKSPQRANLHKEKFV